MASLASWNYKNSEWNFIAHLQMNLLRKMGDFSPHMCLSICNGLASAQMKFTNNMPWNVLFSTMPDPSALSSVKWPWLAFLCKLYSTLLAAMKVWALSLLVSVVFTWRQQNIVFPCVNHVHLKIAEHCVSVLCCSVRDYRALFPWWSCSARDYRALFPCWSCSAGDCRALLLGVMSR